MLLPHVRDRAMVMSAIRHGASGGSSLKRAPTPRPPDRDLPDRSREGKRHRLSDDSGPRGAAGGDQLGCSDLNQWYATATTSTEPAICISILDRASAHPSTKVVETALVVHDALDTLKMRSVVKY